MLSAVAVLTKFMFAVKAALVEGPGEGTLFAAALYFGR